jgi:hypothetical protein
MDSYSQPYMHMAWFSLDKGDNNPIRFWDWPAILISRKCIWEDGVKRRETDVNSGDCYTRKYFLLLPIPIFPQLYP